MKKIKILLIFFILIALIFLTIKNINSYYNLGDYYTIEYEYQTKSTVYSCVAFAVLDSIETNIQIKQGKEYDFSEIFLEYASSNRIMGHRILFGGANYKYMLAFINQIKGPVLESEIPNKFYDERDKDIFTNAKSIVTHVDYEIMDYDGSEESIKNVKKAIKKNGAVMAYQYFDITGETLYSAYNQDTYAYYYPNEVEGNDHSVTIIGWDDNYKKENFNEEKRPQNDGAWIVNTYTWKLPNNHLVYVPYEDKNLTYDGMITTTNCVLYDE